MAKMQIEPELITVARAAELLSCSRAKIYDLHRAGVLELRKIGYRSTRVSKDSVDRIVTDPALLKCRPLKPPPIAGDTPRRLRLREAAEYIGISEDTLYRLRANGEGPPFIKIGQILLYDTRDIDAWLATKREIHRSISSLPIKDAR